MTPEKYAGIYSTAPNHPTEELAPTVSDETLLELAEIAKNTISQPPAASQ